MEDAAAKIKAYFAPFLQDYDLDPDEDIFALGFVNSIVFMQLVVFLEQEFDIRFQEERFNIDNFRTVNAMVRLIETYAVVV